MKESDFLFPNHSVGSVLTIADADRREVGGEGISGDRAVSAMRIRHCDGSDYCSKEGVDE